MSQIDLCLSPDLLHLYEHSGHIVIVADIFRATSVIVTALGLGATSIQLFDQLGDCLMVGQFKNQLTIGEREGLKAEGFDLGNSPTALTSALVNGREIAMTTTNGTHAVMLAANAKQILIASFQNIKATADYLNLPENQDTPVLVLCAAWKGMPCVEDSLFAGALQSALRSSHEWASDNCILANSLYQEAMAFPEGMLGFVKQASHYKRLAKLGISEDIDYCQNRKATIIT
jgi:2-phosphosulfolactate phosphatase